MTAPTKTLNTTNAENFHRSASAPVGIVAAVSMKTIWNRKYANTGAVYATPVRKNPVPPNKPQSLPAIVMETSFASLSYPPSVPSAPTPPAWSAKPTAQYASIAMP
jgi:hypothetical protein